MLVTSSSKYQFRLVCRSKIKPGSIYDGSNQNNLIKTTNEIISENAIK